MASASQSSRNTHTGVVAPGLASDHAFHLQAQASRAARAEAARAQRQRRHLDELLTIDLDDPDPAARERVSQDNF